MSIGHHHVLIVYSLMEHMTWKSPGPMSAHRCLLLSCPLQELLQLLCRRDSQEVRSEDQGTQERNGLFHSWYTDPSLQGKEEQCNSLVSHHRPCRGREPCHRLGQGKRGRQRGTATDQMDKRGNLDKEDTDVHEGSYQLSHTWDQVISRSRAPSSCKQSRRDQDVRQTSKRCHFRLFTVTSFYVREWIHTRESRVADWAGYKSVLVTCEVLHLVLSRYRCDSSTWTISQDDIHV